MKVSKTGAYLSLNRRFFAGLYNKNFIFKPFFLISDIIYHKKIMSILNKVNKNCLINLNFQKKVELIDGCIFYFWWDGFEKLPEICKVCYNSLVKKNPGKEIIFLDKNNYLNYIDLPEFILKKFKNGYFSITLLSDIIRLFLLATYDCVWVDSTMFFIDKIPDSLFNLPFASCNSKKISKDIKDATAIVNNHYPVYFFISKNGFIFRDVITILVNYWNRYDAPIDYFLTNYIFDYVISKNQIYKKYIENMAECNSRVEWLLHHLDDKYDQITFKIIRESTFMFKLNWKTIDISKYKDNSYLSKVVLN